jgi:hypothetical protein
MTKITEAEIEKFRVRTRRLSNSGRFKEVYALSKKYMKKHPDVLLFAYTEAVFTAEDTTGMSPKKADAQFRLAAAKLKRLLPRIRSANPRLRRSLRNEYYWFSKQPLKQYKLGIEYGSEGYYSAGVGAAMLAKKYGLAGRRKLSVRWAKKSEKAWLNFFSKIDRNWFNSYMFYAMSLGFQNRLTEMDRAIARSAKVAGKTQAWRPFRELRAEISEVVEILY